jgi:hypothetical protein
VRALADQEDPVPAERVGHPQLGRPRIGGQDLVVDGRPGQPGEPGVLAPAVIAVARAVSRAVAAG